MTGKDQYPLYINQRNHAKRRGIEMKMTFPEWVQSWGGEIQNRGQGKMVMCRNADQGHYEQGNVRIGSQASNCWEYFRHKLVSDVKEAWSSESGDQSANVDWLESRRSMGYL